MAGVIDRWGFVALVVSLAASCVAGCAGGGGGKGTARLPDVRCDAPVARVDVDAVISHTHERTEMMAVLKPEFDAKQRDLDGDQAEVLAQKEDLEKQSKVLSKEALAQKAAALADKLTALQEKFVRYDHELKQHEANMVTAARKRVRRFVVEHASELAASGGGGGGAISEVGGARAVGVVAIVDEGGTSLWERVGSECRSAGLAQPSVELTDKTIERYETAKPTAATEMKI